MDIEQEIQTIKARNEKVENDKAWERSLTRRLFISIFTYGIAIIWLLMIRDTLPWLKAFIPAAGYFLSTLYLPFLKTRWIKKQTPH